MHMLSRVTAMMFGGWAHESWCLREVAARQARRPPPSPPVWETRAGGDGSEAHGRRLRLPETPEASCGRRRVTTPPACRWQLDQGATHAEIDSLKRMVHALSLRLADVAEEAANAPYAVPPRLS